MSFVLFMGAGIEHLRESVPLEVISTMVSLYRSIFEALANIISSPVGGTIMKSYGNKAMFMSYGCLAAAWGVLFGVYVFKKQCRAVKMV